MWMQRHLALLCFTLSRGLRWGGILGVSSHGCCWAIFIPSALYYLPCVIKGATAYL